MTELASCLEAVETPSGAFPCVREHGHKGPHNPGACGLPYHYAHGEYACTLIKGHLGAHVSWVEQADHEEEIERHDYERDYAREVG